MTESEWLTSDNFSAMMEYLTHQTLPTYSAYGAQTGAVRQELVEPLISQRKLQLLDDACFALFGLNLDDVICQSKPVVGAAALLRSLAGNVFAPLTLPAGEPRRCFRTACRVEGADHRHTQNGDYYCRPCARRINSYQSFELVKMDPEPPPCPWLTPLVVSLAANAYEDNGGRKCRYCNGGPPDLCDRCDHNSGWIGVGTLDPDRLAVLSDAAEEAGCDDERVLRHLRGFERCHNRYCLHGGEHLPGEYPHVCFDCNGEGWILRAVPFFRGDWCLDLFLERK